MDSFILARLQFALTVGFHYIFPPLSIGLGLILVIMEAVYLKTRKRVYYRMTRFWVRVFGLIFAMGVSTGIVMEFEFGTNWATYSRFVGDVFGSALAAEGVFAFFLESGFLALLLFGWDKVSPRIHFLSNVMVALGAHLSAIWIIVANSWQQTPAGYNLVRHGSQFRAEITDFWAMVFNPSTVDRLSHTIMGAWQAGAFLVISVSTWYLLKKKHQDFARAGLKIALTVAMVASLGQLLTGHSSAGMLAEYQPAKLAAMEGHYPAAAPADMYLFGWVNEETEQVHGLKMPGMLSYLLYWDRTVSVTGLNSFTLQDRPPVNATFQVYHLMVAIGMVLIAVSAGGLITYRTGFLFRNRRFQWLLVLAVLLPQIANQVGWIAAEVGRQPWIVYGLLRTSDALSQSVGASAILGSLILFTLIYLLLLVLFLFLLNHKIQTGPQDDALPASHRADL